jgi:hypothetical protein
MDATINYQLMSCQDAFQLAVDQLWVDKPHSFAMQHTSSMAHRICEIIGRDSVRMVADKLALQGVTVSPQAVQKWKHGGNITDENIAALAAAYHSTPEYIKFGTGPVRQLSERQKAAAELVDDPAIGEMVQEGLDFIRYKIEHSPLTSKDPKAMAKYFNMLDILTGRKKL